MSTTIGSVMNMLIFHCHSSIGSSHFHLVVARLQHLNIPGVNTTTHKHTSNAHTHSHLRPVVVFRRTALISINHQLRHQHQPHASKPLILAAGALCSSSSIVRSKYHHVLCERGGDRGSPTGDQPVPVHNINGFATVQAKEREIVSNECNCCPSELKAKASCFRSHADGHELHTHYTGGMWTLFWCVVWR